MPTIEDVIGIDSHGKCEVSIRRIRIVRVEHPVPICVDKDSALPECCRFRTGVNCEASDEAGTRLSVTCWRHKDTGRKTDALIFTIKSIIGWICELVADGQCEAIVRQSLPGCCGSERQYNIA